MVKQSTVFSAGLSKENRQLTGKRSKLSDGFQRTFFFFLMCLLIYRLCWVFVAVHGLSLVAASWSRSLVVLGLLIAMASRCRAQTQDRWLWHMGLVAPWHIESSQTRD